MNGQKWRALQVAKQWHTGEQLMAGAQRISESDRGGSTVGRSLNLVHGQANEKRPGRRCNAYTNLPPFT